MISASREFINFYRWHRQIPAKPPGFLRVWCYRRFYRIALDRNERPQATLMRYERIIRRMRKEQET